MRVTIVLPGLWSTPIGGYKVQYEYAAGLVERGHSVTIVHPMTLSRRQKTRSLFDCLNIFLKHRVRGHGMVSWFALDRRVKLRIVPILAGPLLPRADVTILTADQTANATRHPARRAGRFVQIVYDYEYWMSGTEETRAQMQAALRRIDVAHLSTSSAVTGMLTEMGITPAGFVTSGIDLELFECLVPPSSRSSLVGFSARSGPTKAMPVMIEACRIVHSRRHDISFISYGSGLPTSIPSVVRHLGPLSPTDLRRFYNDCMIFVLPSDYEGWGLPAAEAMACGACLVTTANGGVQDFAYDRVNALVVPRRDPEAIAAAIEELVDNADLRFALVHNALQKAQELGLDQAVDRLEGVLRKAARGSYQVVRVPAPEQLPDPSP
jgi:L-malate glycosyltransferase